MGGDQQVARSQDAGEGRVARAACGGFQSLAGKFDDDAFDPQRQLQPCAQRCAVDFPGIGVGMQAVMHMDGAHAAGPSGGQRVQQCGGIQAAAQRHPQRGLGRGGGQGGQQVGR